MQLTERVVLVTGGGRGMGAAAVRGLLNAGAKVAALDLSWGKIDEYWTDAGAFRKATEASGERFLCLEGDISNDGDLDKAYAAVMQRFGTIDSMINNAALIQHHVFKPTGRVKILDTQDSDWEKMFKINVFGTLKVIRRFVQPMIANRRGSIVNLISSGIFEKTARPHSMEQPYMASKAALGNMTMYLASELREHNIAANAVSPGHAEMAGWELVDAARRNAGMDAPVNRQTPEHIVPLLKFLASRDASNGPTGCFIDTNEWNLHHGHSAPSF